MLLRELAAQTPEQRAEWVKKVRAAPNGQATELDQDIRALEDQYGMSTADMKAAFKRGDLEDTADIAEWLVLARLRG